MAWSVWPAWAARATAAWVLKARFIRCMSIRLFSGRGVGRAIAAWRFRALKERKIPFLPDLEPRPQQCLFLL